MKAAFLGFIGSFALLGASCSCSVSEFVPVVLENGSYANSYTMPPKAAIDAGDISDYYGKYAFRFGAISKNLANYDLFVPGYEMNGATGQIITGSYSYRSTEAYTPCKPNTVYSKSYTAGPYGDSFNVYCYDSSFNFIARAASHSDQSFVTPSNASYFRFEAVVGASKFMLNEGSSLLPYTPYAYGISYDTPITGVGAVALARDSEGYLQDIAIYNDGNFRLDSDFIAWNFSGASDLGSSFIDLLQVAQEQGTFVNMDWEPNTEGWHEIGFCPSDTSLPAYCEFEVGSSASYDNLGMVSHLTSLVVSYYYHDSPSAEEWSRYSLTYTDSAVGVVLPTLYGGLVNVRELCRRVTSTAHYDANEYSFRFIYDQPKNINSDPLYIDYHTNTDFTDVQLATRFDVIYRKDGVASYPFAVDLTKDYVGTLNNYNINDQSFDYVTDGLYNEVRVKLPETDTGGELRWFGILSAYANGYADGYASRNTEIDDLTDRILGLEDDLSQYQGRSYEEIYNMGKADGMQSGNQANQVMSGLFGAILSVPMSIFGGLGDMTIVGVSVMSLIASLLLVAVAVVVIKKLL